MKSYIIPTDAEASQVELARILSLFDDLSEAEQDILRERDEIEIEIVDLTTKKSDVEELINNQLKPKAKEFTQMLSDYRAVIRLRNEMDINERFASERTTELRDMQTEDETEMEFKPKDYFGGEFLETVDRYLMEVLTNCKYEGFITAQFLLEIFDIAINCKRKATTSSKGYRTFLNTTLALVIRRYLADNGAYTPGLLLVDSPTLPLKQEVDDRAPESMRTTLFQYLLDKQKNGQIIIIKNEIPDLDYKRG